MNPDASHEGPTVDAFVLAAKQERIRELLAKPKRRRAVLESLYHQAPLDPRYMKKVPPAYQTAERIEALLRAKGAPEQCYVISTERSLDCGSMTLHDALARIVGRGEGTILSCVPGRLAYFEAEEVGERYLLERGGGPTMGWS